MADHLCIRRSEVLLTVNERNGPMLLAEDFLGGGSQLWTAPGRQQAAASAGD